jgi:hypothetical protein
VSAKTDSTDIRRFFNVERGITDATLDAFGVSFPEPDVVHLPYTSGIKGRRHDPDGKRHFFFAEGNAAGLFLSPNMDGDVAFIVEGESDCMRLWQELAADGAGCCVAGLSGINGWKADLSEVFDGFSTVYVILDNDADYKVSSIVDRAWIDIRRSLGPRAVRLVLPDSPVPVKDVCEFFDVYDLSVLREISDAVEDTPLYFNSLDLTKPAPETDWIVQNMVAAHDVNLWVGEPEVGKSWIMMDLAVAVLTGREHFLGRQVHHHGRVLYIDEENPEDVVRQRLERLGLTKEASKGLRYLHHQGVRLDDRPERLIDEAVAFQPELILIDSMTRVHTGDENSAGFIAQLFNDGVNPLVRETGASLVMLHHVNKSDSSSAFGRVRGSSDITGTIDAGYDFKKSGQHIHIASFKTRRAKSGGLIVAEIVDTPDGSVEIQTRQRTVF